MKITLPELPESISEQLKALSKFLKTTDVLQDDVILTYEFTKEELDISTISYVKMRGFISSCSIEYVRTQFITDMVGTVIGGGELIGYKITLIMPKNI